eukprot:655737-Amphidinium_carterae.1
MEDTTVIKVQPLWRSIRSTVSKASQTKQKQVQWNTTSIQEQRKEQQNESDSTTKVEKADNQMQYIPYQQKGQQSGQGKGQWQQRNNKNHNKIKGKSDGKSITCWTYGKKKHTEQ